MKKKKTLQSKRHSRHHSIYMTCWPWFFVVFDTFFFLLFLHSFLSFLPAQKLFQSRNVISRDPVQSRPNPRELATKCVYKPLSFLTEDFLVWRFVLADSFFLFFFYFASGSRADEVWQQQQDGKKKTKSPKRSSRYKQERKPFENTSKMASAHETCHVLLSSTPLRLQSKNEIFPSRRWGFSITHLWKTDGVSWPTTEVSPPTEISNATATTTTTTTPHTNTQSRRVAQKNEFVRQRFTFDCYS